MAARGNSAADCPEFRRWGGIAVVDRRAAAGFAGLLLIAPFGAHAAGFEPVSVDSDCPTIRLSVAGTYRGGIYSRNTPASPPGYDALTKRLFIGSGDRRAVDVVDISNPYAPTKLFEIDLLDYGGEPTSVAVHKGVVAVTVVNPDDVTEGAALVFFDAQQGDLVAGPINLPGASRIAFTPNGRKLVVGISGSTDYAPDTVDPEGAVAVVDLGSPNWGLCRQGPAQCHIDPAVRVAGFEAFNDRRDELIVAGVRIYGPGATVAQDLEPEGFGITRDSRFAWMSLERNNAFAVVDLHRAEILEILPLGFKDHSLPENGFDASDRDNAIKIQPWPVRSFYSPDGTAIIGGGGQTFVVTANEGDPRDFDEYSEKVRLRNLPLDITRFPDASDLQGNANIGRLQVTNVNGDIDGDLDYDEIYMLGSRSLSVWTPDGELVFDSGDDFERYTADAVPAYFNTTEDTNDFDARSDDRGPEPEHLAIGRVGSQTYAFVAFERIGGIIAYNVTDPHEPRFEQYINNRNFSVDPEMVCGEKGQPQIPGCDQAGDLEPEDMVFISKAESPIGAPLLAVNHELSDSTTVYRIDRTGLLPPRCEAP